MSELVGTFVWGLVLAFHFTGWGRALRRLLGYEGSCRLGELGAVGLAGTLIAGSVMNLLGIISRPVLLAWIGLGFAFELWAWRARAPELLATARALSPRALFGVRGAGVLLSVLALAFYSGTLAAYGFDAFGGGFNGHDDAHAYVMFPHQMLEQGALSEDPFNERRMISSLGGQSFLHALVLAVLPDESLKSLDPGLGFLGCVALMYGAVRSSGMPGWSLLPLGGMFFVVRYPTVNLSSLGTSLYALLALPWLSYRWAVPSRPWANGCLIGLLAAGAIVLKSVNVPTVGVFCAWYGLFRVLTADDRRGACLEQGLSLGALVVCLLPGMVSMYRSSGTPLYPLLGTGYGGGGSQLAEAELSWVETIVDQLGSMDVIVLLTLTLLSLGTLRPRSREWVVCLGMALAALVTALGLARVFQGQHPRYHFAAVTAAIAVGAYFTLASRRWYANLVSTSVLGLLPFHAPDIAYRFLPHWEQLPNAWSAQQQLRDQQPAVRALQDRVPEGAPLLARLDAPYLFDFARNPIYAVDLPCGVGAPPGLPCDGGVDTLVRYLRANGIDYVAFSHRNEANYPRRHFAHYLTGSDPLMRIQATRAFRFHELLRRIEQCYGKKFDDGERWLVQLDERDCRRSRARRRATRRGGRRAAPGR